MLAAKFSFSDIVALAESKYCAQDEPFQPALNEKHVVLLSCVESMLDIQVVECCAEIRGKGRIEQQIESVARLGQADDLAIVLGVFEHVAVVHINTVRLGE